VSRSYAVQIAAACQKTATSCALQTLLTHDAAGRDRHTEVRLKLDYAAAVDSYLSQLQDRYRVVPLRAVSQIPVSPTRWRALWHTTSHDPRSRR